MDWMPTVTATLTGVLGIVLGSRLRRAENRETQEQAGLQQYYLELSKRVDSYAQRLDHLEAENAELRRENMRILAEKAPLEARIAELETKVLDLEARQGERECLDLGCTKRKRPVSRPGNSGGPPYLPPLAA